MPRSYLLLFMMAIAWLLASCSAGMCGRSQSGDQAVGAQPIEVVQVDKHGKVSLATAELTLSRVLYAQNTRDGGSVIAAFDAGNGQWISVFRCHRFGSSFSNVVLVRLESAPLRTGTQLASDVVSVAYRSDHDLGKILHAKPDGFLDISIARRTFVAALWRQIGAHYDRDIVLEAIRVAQTDGDAQYNKSIAPRITAEEFRQLVALLSLDEDLERLASGACEWPRIQSTGGRGLKSKKSLNGDPHWLAAEKCMLAAAASGILPELILAAETITSTGDHPGAGS